MKKSHDGCKELCAVGLRCCFSSRQVINNHRAKYLHICIHRAQLKRPRGPEIENWFGVEDGTDPAVENDWSFLPFMALSDGAHA